MSDYGIGLHGVCCSNQIAGIKMSAAEASETRKPRLVRD